MATGTTMVFGEKPIVNAFISYSSKDATFAELLRDTIAGDGISCFYAPTSIEPLEDWRKRLESDIEQAHVLLLLYTEAAGNSDQVYEEIDLARKLNKEIWLLKDKDTAITDRFRTLQVGSRYHAFLFAAGQELETFQTVFGVLNRRFGRTPSSLGGKIDHNENPYPGKPYSAAEGDLFFGRDQECDQLLADIKSRKEQVFFVYGPSGTGKSSLIDAGLRKRAPLERWWLSPPLKPSGDEPDATAINMWRQAEQAFQSGVNIELRPEPQIVSSILSATSDPKYTFYLFWFDQTENLLALESKHVWRFFRMANDLLRQNSNIRIIITFREEWLSPARRFAEKSLLAVKWHEWYLSRLTREGALSSVRLPPERKSRVEIQETLADALVDELARVEYVDLHGNKVEVINPVSLQLVCRRLWRAGIEGLSDITENDVLIGEGLSDIKSFVKNALENHLEDAIERIALHLSSGDVAGRVEQKITDKVEQKKDVIRLGLLQFVTEDRRRQQLPEELDGNQTRVGRLQGEVIQQLYEGRLLQRINIGISNPDYRYELVHDSLVEAITRYSAKISLLQTLNTLESTLRGARAKDKRLYGVFNRNTDLLAELENARNEETGFFEDEKEFLFRCALGNQRKSANKEISLEEWALLVAKGCIETFARVLDEALWFDDDSVRSDAIVLLMKKEFRERLPFEEFTKLSKRIKGAALDKTSEAQGAACIAVCQLSEPPGAAELFSEMDKDSKDAKDQARSAIGYVRDAVDRGEINDNRAREGFEKNWRNMSHLQRLFILGPLWWRRFKRSFVWMLFVVVIATVMTAVGAALAFIPMGALGASLTLANRTAGWAKGPFHGLAGGTFWAIGISSSLMFYWVILRGGRVLPDLRRWIPAALFAAFGGFGGGIALALVIGFVFEGASLYSAGWLENATSNARLEEMFLVTFHGWWTPILGAAVAIGVSWGLQNLSGDPRADKFLTEKSGQINRKKDMFRTVFRIWTFVITRSWRIAVPVVVGGLCVLAFLHPGKGICDDLHLPTQTSELSTQKPCNSDSTLAPLPARVGGIVFIISVGGLFLEVGILIGIFVARTGVKVERDEKFLQALQS